MSGVDVTHGGVITVDPEQLRAVADGLGALAPKFSDAAADARRSELFVALIPGGGRSVDGPALSASASRAEAMYRECLKAVENTRLMADVYELVERRAELAALAIQGVQPSDTLLDRIEELEASDPRVLAMEALLMAQWKKNGYEGPDGGAFFGTIAAIAATGFGRIPPGQTLSGTAGPVRVTPTRTDAPIGPPNSIAEALRRLPDKSDAQIRVEKYTMADGTRQFVLYSKGTQSPLWGGDEPFDMKSNWELYSREQSESYAATVKALTESGAQAGDEVHVYAHSQAAMVAGYLGSESEFNVTVQVTAGSPIQMDAGEDVLKIDLQHPQDVVLSLADGGLPGGAGSPDSLVVTRDADSLKWGFPGHMLSEYIETAELLDVSGDVRLEAWLEKIRELNEAVEIEGIDYVAERE